MQTDLRLKKVLQVDNGQNRLELYSFELTRKSKNLLFPPVCTDFVEALCSVLLFTRYKLSVKLKNHICCLVRPQERLSRRLQTLTIKRI